MSVPNPASTDWVPLYAGAQAGADLSYDGDHVGATVYEDGQIVVKDGIAYLCVGGPTTQAPNPVPWGPAGMMSGYATLTGGKVPTAQLPSYQSHTPTLTASVTNPTIATSTCLGRFVQIGSLVHYFAKFLFQGAFVAGSGNWRISLPVAASFTTMSNPASGTVRMHNIDATVAMAVCFVSAAGQWLEMRYPATWPVGANTAVSHDKPWAWASGAELNIEVVYEAA